MRVVGGTVEDPDICEGPEANGKGCEGDKDTSLAHTGTTHMGYTRRLIQTCGKDQIGIHTSTEVSMHAGSEHTGQMSKDIPEQDLDFPYQIDMGRINVSLHGFHC